MKAATGSSVIVKLILIGDTSVGKTSLLLRFSEQNFNETHITTIGKYSREKHD